MRIETINKYNYLDWLFFKGNHCKSQETEVRKDLQFTSKMKQPKVNWPRGEDGVSGARWTLSTPQCVDKYRLLLYPHIQQQNLCGSNLCEVLKCTFVTQTQMLWDNIVADDGLLRALKTISIPEPLSIYREAHLLMNEAETCNLSRCNLKHRYRSERLCCTRKSWGTSLDLTNSERET